MDLIYPSFSVAYTPRTRSYTLTIHTRARAGSKASLGFTSKFLTPMTAYIKNKGWQITHINIHHAILFSRLYAARRSLLRGLFWGDNIINI